MTEEKKEKNWTGLILGGISLLAIISSLIFGFAKNAELEKERQARIQAQNEIARLSVTEQETQGVWSRLAQEQQNIKEQLAQNNQVLANLITERDEQIISLTKAVGRIRNVRVVVDRPNVTETQQTSPDGTSRLRVDFDQMHSDFIRIAGHTLTNPAEAEISLEFPKPLELTVVSTQNPDLSWRTYVESNWQELEIQNIESSIHPLEQNKKQWFENIFFGFSGMTNTDFNGGFAAVDLGYDFGIFSFGPSFGGAFTSDSGVFLFGLRAQINPF